MENEIGEVNDLEIKILEFNEIQNKDYYRTWKT